MFQSMQKSMGGIIFLGALSVFAKGTAPVQNHQCMKDGAVVVKTRKECKKAGGTWDLMAKTDVKPMEKAAEAKSAEMKPAEVKPTEAKPVEVKAAEVKPAPAATPAPAAPAKP
jgi:hypothetical protein